MKFNNEVELVINSARKKTLEINRTVISSDILLWAILQYDNEATKLLSEKNVNVFQLKNTLDSTISTSMQLFDVPVTGVVNFSTQVMNIFKFAETISTGHITTLSLLSAIYQENSASACSALINAGYTEGNVPVRKKNVGFFSKRDNTPATDKFSEDLTKKAAMELLDPVIGRDEEISLMVEILARRKKNNPILIGEPGVGKTSLVEGLALRIISGKIPEVLANKRIISLNLTAVVAGTMFRGQYEERMKRILQELSHAPNTIVFIDEIHTLMGNGGSEGVGDAAQIIKPALTNGTFRCIGATTFKEFKKHIEKDGALERRFHKVLVEPPTAKETRTIVNDVKFLYETFHKVSYDNLVLDTVIETSARYIHERNFPDKAIDVLDAAGTIARLAKRQVVEVGDVQTVISKSTGIPITQVGKTEREKLLSMEQDLNSVVIGQEDGIKAITNSIKRIRTGVRVSPRPVSFLLLGGTGVGKTETARQLAKHLFDSKDSLIRLDMSEYMEKFSLSGLIGAPPGYVGYEEGGKLTEAVRKKPYSVVLFDEIEKAHPDIFNVLLQVFDDGFLTDASGRKVIFSNTIIIITSNVGTQKLHTTNLGFDKTEDFNINLNKELKAHFRPEFLNRLDEVIFYKHLTKDHMKKILAIYLKQMNPKFVINISDDAQNNLIEKGYSKEYGARPLRRLLEKEIEGQIADILLEFPETTQFFVNLINNKLITEKI